MQALDNPARDDRANPAVPISWLLEAGARLFEGAGLSPAAAARVTEGLVEGDMRGIPSHGLMLLPMYVERIQAGSVTLAERAEVVLDGGAIVVLDAQNALGILTGDQAMELAIERSGEHGIALVAVRHAFHFGGAFRYVRAATRADRIGIAAANTRPLMPAPGGAKAVVGNNPLAIGVPRPGEEPIILDMALSEAALGKIRMAEAQGREIPPTWATDAEGTPTTDPRAAIDGLLLPAAGPKGFGLALMVDVLSGVLSGGSSGSGVKGLYQDYSVPNDCAHVFIAIDPAAAGGGEAFGAGVRELAAEVLSSPTAPGVERVRLPGELEQEREQRAREHGVEMAEPVMASLRELAARLTIELPPLPTAATGDGHAR